MIAASGWNGALADSLDEVLPLVDPCCGSGTLLIEAAQIALRMPAGWLRRFAFEKLLPFQPHVWQSVRDEAQRAQREWPAGHPPIVFGSDVSFRMVDFARRNAERAGVAQAIELRGGDALQRPPPVSRPGMLLLNPPYGERIAAAGVAGQRAEQRAASRSQGGRESAQVGDGGDDADFFRQLATHWKTGFAGWTAWLLTTDLKLPGKMRFKESRRVPLWNGPIECRLFRFDIQARRPSSVAPGGADHEPA